MPILQHLEELRRRLLVVFGALVAATACSVPLTPALIDFLARPVGGLKGLVAIDVTENAYVFMRVSLLSGVALAMPVLLHQTLRFVLPGVTTLERRWLLASVIGASLLFVVGVTFTWFVLLPVAVPFLTQLLPIPTHVRPQSYIGFVTRLLFWIGLSFEMPVLVLLLARLGLTTAGQLARQWRFAVVGIAVAAAAITPTVDPLNMVFVMLPLAGLYGISIGVAVVAGRAHS